MEKSLKIFSSFMPGGGGSWCGLEASTAGIHSMSSSGRIYIHPEYIHRMSHQCITMQYSSGLSPYLSLSKASATVRTYAKWCLLI